MEKEQRNRLQKATQDARRLLEEEFAGQLLEAYDINAAAGRWNDEPGAHLQAEQRLLREKLLAWIEHKEAQIGNRKEALLLALREMAFTALNRFVALKLMEARQLVRPCVSGALESEGFQEFTAVAQGLLSDQESSYRLYLETIFEDVSRELRALFDPRDPASLLWPKRTALLELLVILNRPELVELWIEDETLGWVYQYFNGDAERKKMREESSAPRNSRELAVRNQFFTPRYVVEFLTDNTLGRIWYEMRQGDTSLKERCRYLVRRPNEIWLQPGEDAPAEIVADEALSQEELLQQPVAIPHRPLKDPREIRMLDPACGSMHFGLYAFDLYLAIYSEAWEIAQASDEQAKHGEAFSAFVVYAADFASKAAFLREAPRLILLHNIHGVDIDPRATQIAKLTLWLRAQRAWQEQQLEVAARPAITRSNVVCAEPMPGEKQLLAEFVDQQFPEVERGLVQQLLESIFDKMQLAGEAGSLLKIEQGIKDDIEEARGRWQSLAIQQTSLFGSIETPIPGKLGATLEAHLQRIGKEFWHGIEDRIYSALDAYTNGVQGREGFQRKLFADDASQGFAFIDICRKQYDTILMNPPFGLSPEASFLYARDAYPDSYTELLAAFIDRGKSLSSGSVGAITSRSFMVANRLDKWRRTVAIPSVTLIADLGNDVMDGAFVEAAAYTLQQNPNLNLLAIDARKSGGQPSAELSRWAQGERLPNSACIDRRSFYLFPKHRIVYSLPPKIISLMQSREKFEPLAGTAREGFRTWDDFRFVKLYWEVDPSDVGNGKTWEPLMKGGAYSRYQSNIHLLANTKSGLAESCAINIQKNGTDAQARQASTYWRRPGITYSTRSQKGFSARVMPTGCMFTGQGPLVVSETSTPNEYILGWLNSKFITGLLEIQANDGKFLTGLIKTLPWKDPGGLADTELMEQATKQLLSQLIKLSSFSESERYFVCPPSGSSISEMHRVASRSLESAEQHTRQHDAAWNVFINSLYHVSEDDVIALNIQAHTDSDSYEAPVDEEIGDDDEPYAYRASPQSTAALFISYVVGVALGRWDIRFALSRKDPERSFDPFAPIPVCPPGQLQSVHGLPTCPADTPRDYPIDIPWDGILVNDDGQARDILSCISEVVCLYANATGGASASEIQNEICECLRISSIREWFQRPSNFFADHIQHYSKSRRQAPIYWQLSAGTVSYSAWLYYHRFTQDTLYRVLRDFVEPRIQQAEREQFELESQGTLSGDAAGLLHEVQVLLQDLRLFKNELDLVAPLWNPNLNDGVIINHAILWRITPYTPWQKKCKECWDKLVKGDYDWAHIAFHLWPERVVRKCITDRSLAIAHGLEERLWQETNKSNWLPRQVSEAELQALIAEHTKPAVQNDLERFLAAPPPVAAARTRAPRAAKLTSSGSTRKPRGSATPIDAEAARQTLLVLTAAPAEGLGRNAIADLLGVEASALTAVIKQLKENGQIEQLGAARGAKYRLTESGRPSMESEVDE